MNNSKTVAGNSVDVEKELPPSSQSTIALVANPIKFSDDSQLPFVISRGVEFDRATTSEVIQIKEMLNEVVGNSALSGPFSFYESELKCREDGSGYFDSFPLDEPDWRYYVVRSPDGGIINYDLHLVCLISEACLNLSTVCLHSFGNSCSPYGILGLYSYQDHKNPSMVTTENLHEITELYKIKRLNSSRDGALEPYPELNRALHMLSEIDHIPPNSSFHVIGYFAIIEMLITHNPKLEDRGDSITHQMRSKIPFLSKRFDRLLPYKDFFGNVSPEKVWNSLYSYRSANAHGGQPDFKGGLQLLKNEKHANEFLRITTQALIRHAMRDPELYRDLKQC